MNSLNNASLLAKAINTPLPAESVTSRSASMVSATTAAGKSALNDDTLATMARMSDARSYAKLSRSPSVKSCTASINCASFLCESVNLAKAKPASATQKALAVMSTLGKSAGTATALAALKLPAAVALGVTYVAGIIGIFLGGAIGALMGLMPGKTVRKSAIKGAENGAQWGAFVPYRVYAGLSELAEKFSG